MFHLCYGYDFHVTDVIRYQIFKDIFILPHWLTTKKSERKKCGQLGFEKREDEGIRGGEGTGGPRDCQILF